MNDISRNMCFFRWSILILRPLVYLAVGHSAAWAQLATIGCRQQLLTWLVQGTVAWQRDGLGGLPKKMKDVMKSYVAENDLLQEFLDEDCDVGADYEAMTTRFCALFIKKKGGVSDKELVKMMEGRVSLRR